MLNQVVVVGRLVKNPEVRFTNDGKKVSHVTLAVNRNFKNNATGKYDTDFLYCTLWEGIAQATATHCKKGSILGVKGRLTSKHFESQHNTRLSYPEIVAEKVTFISHNSNEYVEEID